MGILRKPHEESAVYIPSGVPAAASGVLSIDNYPDLLIKDIVKVGTVVVQTPGAGQVTTVDEIPVATDPNSIYSISLGGIDEGAMTTRTQTVSVRQNAANSISNADLNAAFVVALNAKFGRHIIASLAPGVIVITSRLAGPSFSTQVYTDDTNLGFGLITVTVPPVYPSGQLANRASANQPEQLRDLFPHLTEVSPPFAGSVTTVLDKIEVTVYDRNVNGGDGSGRKKVISFYGTNAQVSAIATAIALSGSNAQL
jgi:hypothetical protein